MICFVHYFTLITLESRVHYTEQRRSCSSPRLIFLLFLFNTFRRRLSSLCCGRCLVLVGDKGYASEQEMSGQRDPHIAYHGSLSCMVRERWIHLKCALFLSPPPPPPPNKKLKVKRQTPNLLPWNVRQPCIVFTTRSVKWGFVKTSVA